MPEIIPPEPQSPPTLGLCVITAEYTAELERKLLRLAPYVDAIYVQINGESTNAQNASTITESINKLNATGTEVYIYRYVWTNDFAAARNDLLAKVKTDYWTWLDTDDDIDAPDALRDIVELMDEEDLDVMYAPYEYSHDTDGNPNVTQWRERVIRTGAPVTWVGRVHEVLQAESGEHVEVSRTDLISWIHEKTEAEHIESRKRNHNLLLLAVQESPTFTNLFNLAQSHLGRGEWEPAIRYYTEALDAGTPIAPEDRRTIYRRMGDCWRQKHRYSDAREEYLRALELDPTHPAAYYDLAQSYVDEATSKEHIAPLYARALEWLQMGLGKPVPDETTTHDPGSLTYKPLGLTAMVLFQLGRYQQAYEIARTTLEKYPDYSALREQLPTFDEAYRAEVSATRTLELVRWIEQAFGTESALKVIDALPSTLASQPPLMRARLAMSPPQTWPAGSVVYLCGRTTEPWGPDMPSSGIGGSEEAVMNLSRELAKLHCDVYVFNARPTEYVAEYEKCSHAVGLVHYPTSHWTPFERFNTRDEFDTLIVWRMPELGAGIKARRKLLDLHDTVEPERVYRYAAEYDRIMVKSLYHRSLYPDLPDAKFVIVGNGINLEDFR